MGARGFMKAVCDTCGARYRIPDEKVIGKSLRIRCKKCGNIFKVQEQREHVESEEPQAQWYFAIKGESFGPFSHEAMIQRFGSGKLDEQTYVWRDGLSDWIPVSEHPEFYAALELSKTSLQHYAGLNHAETVTEGSGRFTVELKRPGTTLDAADDERSSALDNEVDHAFQSLLEQGQNDQEPYDDSTSDQSTAPMRSLAGAQRKERKERTPQGSLPSASLKQDAGSGTTSAARSKSDTTSAPEKKKSSRPLPRSRSTEPDTAVGKAKASSKPISEPAKDEKKSGGADEDEQPTAPIAGAQTVPPKRTSAAPPRRARASAGGGETLAERLARIREQTETMNVRRATGNFKSIARPTDATQDPEDAADISAKNAEAAKEDIFPDLRKGKKIHAAIEDDEFILPPKDGESVEDVKEKPSALPSGPIRQVTQELNVGDLFSDLTGDFSSIAQANAAPTDVQKPSEAELLAFLQKRKEAQNEKSASPTDDKATPVGGTAAVARPTKSTTSKTAVNSVAAATTDASTRPEDSTVAALAIATENINRKRRIMLSLVIFMGVLLLVLVAFFMYRAFSDARTSHRVIPAETTTTEQHHASVDTTDSLNVKRARNRAIGIVAKARSTAESAAFVAGEDGRNARYAANTRTRSNARSGTSRGTSADNQHVDFHFGGAGTSVQVQAASTSKSGPSKATFASTLQSAVATSVGRCAQRTQAMTGGLPVARLELSITIMPDGTVKNVNAQKQARGSKLMNCIQTESSRWRFVAFDGTSSTTISHPFVLQ